MYRVVPTCGKRLDEYRPDVGEAAVEAVRTLAKPLRGARVLMLSFSPFGARVPELLRALVPLLRDLGLAAEWQVVRSAPEFGRATRLLYQGLSGRPVDWRPDLAEAWRRFCGFNAASFDREYDAVVVHDPQVAGLLPALTARGRAARGGRWVWHCHLDLRGAQPDVWQTVRATLDGYEALVFADASFVPPDLRSAPVAVIPPAIDPTSPSNRELPADAIRALLAGHGLDPGRPLLVQAGHLTPAFDPLGAIEAYRRAKADRRDLQLLLVGPVPEDTAVDWSRFEQIARHAAGDPDVRVLVARGVAGQRLMNAAQRAARLVLQRAVPAGFAPQVWEAQWKGRAVVAGPAGSLPAQVAHGQTGLLAGDEDAFVRAILALLADPARAARLGATGREAVRRRHLIPHWLADELRLLGGILAGAPRRGLGEAAPTLVR